MALALVMFLPAFALGAAAPVDGEIVLGVFEPQTGENGGGGFQEVLGMRYANTVYPTVKVDGKVTNVELVEADNKSDKTEAVSAAYTLIAAGVPSCSAPTARACPSRQARSSRRHKCPPSAHPAPTRR